ncbi:MAG: DNA polymerase III subunit alpha, partial [Chloroflexi bacterium]|nr:DNA polymerase III subunit alpha [Chloroflexota bacterium]
IDHDYLAAHAEGLICTSGCMSAEIPRAILQDNPEAARKKLDWYYEVFGPENFFIELQNHDIPELPGLNKTLIELGSRYEANFVVTNDVHYVDRQDARLQDIMLCIQTGSLVSEPNRMRMTGESFYLKSPDEMAALFADVPEALSNTVLIAERNNVNLAPTGYHLPEFEVPADYTTESYLRQLCEDGLVRRYNSHAEDEEIRTRLEYELDVIHRMGFDAYFLIVWDLCQHAANENIWYNARGSAAGSMVAYCLDITLVDPIEHGLLFERFLNPDRISMPDIDLDFQDDQRNKIMEYCAQRYGEDKVASIITFGKMKARAAIRDVARVLDIPLNEVDKIAKMIPNVPGNSVTIEQALEKIPDFKQEYESKSYVRELVDTAKEMEGVIRNAGTHAAGVIITDKPVVEYIPLNRPTNNSKDTPIKTVTQFEMSTVDHLGLLKVDFLGLATLTIMARACNLINQRHGIEYDLNTIPVDDPKTYELLGKGETAGVFQFEGAGMRRWMMEMKPESLDNAVAMVALFRPGPMEFIPQYISRMHGEEEVTYRHPSLEPLFSETYGIAVYQEQLMLAAMELADYTGAEADDLRKAISKKLADKIEKHRRKFIKGAAAKGMPEKTAADIFKDWENFARYGFNKSHAADYGVIAVQTAFLKANYPVEYMTALLSVAHHDTDKIAFYVGDCRRMGIEILPPDVNFSIWDFTVEDRSDGDPAIRFGMSAIKNVGKGPVEAILTGRGDMPFENHGDFARRVDLRQVGKRALECLIKVGALDCFGHRSAVMQIMNQLTAISSTHFQAAEKGQISFFGGDNGLDEEITMPTVKPDLNQREHLNWERELTGLYLSDHPLNPVKDKLDKLVSHNSGDLALAENKEQVRVAGMVTRIRRHMTKKGDPMAFIAIEDTLGEIELVVFPRVWAKVVEQIQFDKVIVVAGKVDAAGSEPKILADKIWMDLDKVPAKDKAAKKKPSAQKRAKEANGSAPTPTIQEDVQIAEERDVYDLMESAPPPPENWDEDVNAPGTQSDKMESADGNEAAKESATETMQTNENGDNVNGGSNPKLSDTANERIKNLPKPIVDPRPEKTSGMLSSKLVTVQIDTSGDKARDILRIRRIYGMLISYPGNDR